VSGGEDADSSGSETALPGNRKLRPARPLLVRWSLHHFEWRRGRFGAFSIHTDFRAKQWRHFRAGERTFLALAQGISLANVTGDETRPTP